MRKKKRKQWRVKRGLVQILIPGWETREDSKDARDEERARVEEAYEQDGATPVYESERDEGDPAECKIERQAIKRRGEGERGGGGSAFPQSRVRESLYINRRIIEKKCNRNHKSNEL